MPKIGIVSLGYGWLPCEPGPSRFYYIAKMFSEKGWDVDLIGTSFQHFKKAPRDKELILSQNYPFKTSFIDVKPYKKNIDIRRIISNKGAVGKTVEYLRKNEYDVIYCSIPQNDVASAVADYCEERHIPLIVDIEDLWPEAMEMVVKNKLLRKVIFPSFFKDAENVYAKASAAIGTSEDYTARAVKYNHRDLPMKTVYVGCDMDIFDQGVRDNIDSIDKGAEEFWVTYAGSIGKSYDIDTLIKAAAELCRDGYENIKIKILGTGPRFEEMKKLKADLGAKNVDFLGYTQYPIMAAYLTKSEVALNSFIKGAPQSIANKVGDYLASGSAVLNTLENDVAKSLIDSNEVGINIEAEDVEVLKKAILYFYENREITSKMGENARKLCEKRFDRKTSYLEIISMAESLL